MMELRCTVLLLLCCFVVIRGFDPATYEHSQQILPRYEVYWTVNLENSSIALALHVQTTGWVGFGIAEFTSGSMPGADIVLGYVVNGKGTITDRWASQYALPTIDDCSSWELVSAEESNGYTTLEVRRALDTNDEQDRPIVAGPNRIVVAFGENDIDTPGYHHTNRVTGEITFYGESEVPPLPEEVKSVELRVPNFTVPNGKTNYICASFTLPSDKEYSIIQMDPIINEQNIAHVHHFIAHSCVRSNAYVEKYTQPGDCFMGENDDSECSDIIMGWAAGGGSTYLPSEAGFLMGNPERGARFVVLQIHYNNADGVGGYVDNSGIRLWYTDKLRTYEAAMIVLGDAGTNYPPIPPNAITEYESECPSISTKTLSQEIHVWQSLPHMHQVGSQIWTTQWRNDEQINEFGRVEYWAFDHQQTQIVDIIIKPGDRLNTHCIYDTRTKNAVTIFGLSSTDEMCMHFLGYYPRLVSPTSPRNGTWGVCGYVTPNYTMYGDFDFVPYPNPTIIDPKGGNNRTFGISSKCDSTGGSPGSAGTLSAPSLLLYIAFFVLLKLL